MKCDHELEQKLVLGFVETTEGRSYYLKLHNKGRHGYRFKQTQVHVQRNAESVQYEVLASFVFIRSPFALGASYSFF